MKQCEICNITFTNAKSYSNHIRWKHKKVEYKRQICNCCNKNIRVENFTKHNDVCKIKHCKHCNTEIRGGRNIFCNSMCSANYNNKHRDHNNTNRSYITDEWRARQSNYTKTHWNKGTHNPSRTIFSSKKEKEIVKHLKILNTNKGVKTANMVQCGLQIF